MQELERQFKADGGTFEEYKIGDLFIVKNNPQLDKEHFTFSGNAQYPYFTRTENNNGVLGYVDYLDEKHLINGNSLAIGMISMLFHYMSHDFYAGQFTKTAFPKFDGFNENVALYFISLLCKFQKIYQGVLVRDFEQTFYDSIVYLPTLEGEISFSYMENVIHELQNESIIKLNNYLKLNGLENTELTQEEKDAVLQLRSGEVKWKEFKVGELFDIHPTNAYKLTNSHIFHDDGKNPVVTNSSVNNGITGYSNLSPTERGNMITYSDTTTSEGIFYQPDDFVGYPHVQGLYPKRDSDKWNEKTLLFFVSLFRKTAGGRFDYANKFNRTIASQMLVSIPITTNGTIDWTFMQNLISAESRLAVRGVVKWKDSIGNISQNDV